jgi:2-iminobutanoate/2-iminopropanoate deaminase
MSQNINEKKRISSAQAPAAIGPYSQAIGLGNLVFCSGQIPLDPQSMQIEATEIRTQTQKVLANLKAVLAAAGSSPAKILKTTVFLTDLKNFEVFNQEYGAFFEKEGASAPTPARSTIQVSGLPRGALVEVEAIAYT